MHFQATRWFSLRIFNSLSLSLSDGYTCFASFAVPPVFDGSVEERKKLGRERISRSLEIVKDFALAMENVSQAVSVFL